LVRGERNRAYKKGKGEVSPPKDKSRIIFLKQNLTEEEAFKHEIYMIAVFGRKDLGTGILRNKTNGGEGASGAVRSEEYKIKMSEARKGENSSWYGRKHSQETREKMKKSAKRGETHHMYGKTHTEETRDKMSKSQKGRPSPKGMLGKKHTEEAKQKMSENREVKSFSVISPTEEIIHSKNAKQFCRDNNLDKGHFSQVLSGKRQSHKGFRLYKGEDT
jgi:hypothetical protein